jgi:hypothetical protein
MRPILFILLFNFYNFCLAQKVEKRQLEAIARFFQKKIPSNFDFNDSTSLQLVNKWSLSYQLGHEPLCMTFQGIPKKIDSSLATSFAKRILEGSEISKSELDPKSEFFIKSFDYPFCDQELAEFRNFFRWIQNFNTEKFIWINIPSNELYFFQAGKMTLKMNVIVGTYKNQTPVFSSVAETFTLFPYWYPTQNIIFDEIIPKVKVDMSFLSRNNYEVLNKKGQSVQPENLNWHSFTRTNFPYRIRQKTGCGNSLGLVKLNIKNPFQIYMHDTQHTRTSLGLFNKPRRFYSHGCIRLQKPKELVLAIESSKPIDEDFMKDCPTDKKPITIDFKMPIPVFIMYFTDFINEKGELISKPDYYRLLKH